MAIGSKQIGWSQEANLLWEISKQLDTTIGFMCTLPCPTTTTTTTAQPLFSGTIFWGNESGVACSEIFPINLTTGDGTTFCNSTVFYSDDFIEIATDGIFISYAGQVRTANVVSGDNFATCTGGCDPCA